MYPAEKNRFFGSLTEEERMLASKLYNMIYLCREKYIPRFTFFLDIGKKNLCEEILKSENFTDFLFYGGYDEAERTVLGLYPPYSLPEENQFPVVGIKFRFSKLSKLSHKDFLGALMSYKIKRETIGDILIDNEECSAVVFIYDTVVDMILSEVRKIGSAGVTAEICSEKPEKPENSFTVINGTVASLRTDAVLSLVTKLSREKSAAIIQSTGIDINYKKYFESDRLLKGSDIFSVKGYGKYIIDEIGGISKKGRIHISVKKYI